MDILDQLKEALSDLTPKLRQAARFALDNPGHIAMESMRSSAAASGVTAPTMVRLANQLGYDSYDAFRDRFRIHVTGGGFAGRATALRHAAKEGQPDGLIGSLGISARDNLEHTLSMIDSRAIERATTRMIEARTVYLLGSGSLNWLVGLLEATASLAVDNVRSSHLGYTSPVEAISTIGDQDVVVVISIAPYARQTIEAARLARQAGALIIGITDRPSSPLSSLCDEMFTAPTSSPHYYPSMTSLFFVAELLMASLVAKLPSTERLDMIEAARQKSGLYIG